MKTVPQCNRFALSLPATGSANPVTKARFAVAFASKHPAVRGAGCYFYDGKETLRARLMPAAPGEGRGQIQ